MSATPRTDIMAKPAKQYVCECVPARFARQLELENQELREALQALVDCPDYRGISTHEMRNARAALACREERKP